MLTTQERARTENMKREESPNRKRRSQRNTRHGKVKKNCRKPGQPASSKTRRTMVIWETVRHKMKEQEKMGSGILVASQLFRFLFQAASFWGF